ncbi:MAG: tRNA pseudouridine(38-40) synthase TruA [Firmicutes bacterium]|nr:tRNA pseudouridine(38-40) synthase TruA [Bacillota bacterium]
MKRNIKITLEYDGTNYSGWQKQKNTTKTIQGVLEKSLSKINKEPVGLTGAGRTDAGVHALGQVANFFINVNIPTDRIPRALNRLIPDDISCKTAEEVEPEFHARYDAKGKKYRYRIYNQRRASVFNRNYVYHYIHSLDYQLMLEAARYFEGTHDFVSFQSAGSSMQDTVRTIELLKVINKETEIWVEIIGNGFLYNMVRIIVGTLIEIGTGKIPYNKIKEIIESGKREKAGFTAPAQGLTLLEVFY